MRVLILGCKDYPAFSTSWVHSGGMEVYTERMVRSLAGRADFTLYTVAGHSDRDARVEALGAARGLRTQPVTLMLRSWRRARQARPEFDLLNAQTPLAGLVARMVRRRFGIPYVVTVHIFGADPSHAGGWVSAAAYSRVQRLVFSESAAIIPTGRTLGAALERRYKGIGSKISVVTAAGEGVKQSAPRDETRARLGIAQNERVLLFLGRLVEENGITNLLDSFVLLRQNHPNLKLLIAGSGDRETELTTRIWNEGMTRMVKMLGSIRGQEKLDVVAAVDLLVRASHHEVFPEAYLEALSVGTPVAATPAGDTPYLAEESGAVAILPFGDPRAQAGVIAGLIDDPERLATMRARALDYADRFRWSAQSDRYWSVLERAAGAGA